MGSSSYALGSPPFPSASSPLPILRINSSQQPTPSAPGEWASVVILGRCSSQPTEKEEDFFFSEKDLRLLLKKWR